jgi:hypothetical protein
MKKSEKGFRGFGFGQLTKTDREFLTADYDDAKLYGREKAVGMFATADRPGVVTDDASDD